MIEPIPKTRTTNEGFEYDVAFTNYELRDKLNEVIEAVNRRDGIDTDTSREIFCKDGQWWDDYGNEFKSVPRELHD